MEKARKWKRVIAIMLTVAMIFQNGASVTAAGDLNGVPETTAESNAQAESEAAAKAESEAAAKAESEAAAKAESEAAAKAESEAAAKAESEAAAKAESEAVAKAESEAQAKAESEAAAKAESEAQAKAESEAAAKAESEAQAKAESEAAAKAESEAAEKAESEKQEADQKQTEDQAENETKATEAAEETKPVTYRVSFEQNASIHGTIYVDQAEVNVSSYYKEVEQNQTFKFTVTASEGYEVEYVRLDNVDLPKTQVENEYQIPNVTKDSQIVVSYKEVPQEVTESSEASETEAAETETDEATEETTAPAVENLVTFQAENAVITVNGTEVTDGTAMAQDGKIVFTVVPADGFEVTEVLVDGSIPARTTGNANEYIIEGIQTDATIVSVSTQAVETETETETETVVETETEVETKTETEVETETETETETEAAMPAQTFTQTAGDTVVTVNAPEGAFPEGTTMNAVPVAAETIVAAMEEQLAEEGKEIVDVVAVDITFYDADGNEIQPAVDVEVSFGNAAVSEEAEEAAIYHIDDAANAEVVAEVAPEDTEVTFQAESFSTYAKVATTAVDDGISTLANNNDRVAVNGKLTLEGESGWNHKWSSSDPDIASVVEKNKYGIVTGNSVGEVRITHTYQSYRGRQTEIFNVTVYTNQSNTYSLYVYTLVPGMELDSGAPVDEKWNGMGVGSISGVNSPSSYPASTNIMGNGEVITYPTSYPDITVNGKTYTYAETGSENASKAGYYTIEWIRVVHADGANTGANGYNPSVSAGTSTFHLDGQIFINENNLYNVTFRIQNPGEDTFTIQEEYSRIVESGYSERRLSRPSTANKVYNGETYIFDGWYYDEACTQRANFTGTIISNVNYYGKYVPEKDTLYYDGNGNTSGSTQPTEGSYQGTVTVSENGFEKIGYEFDGWNTSADGTGQSYKAGSNYILTDAEDVLYAQWKLKDNISYTVKYLDEDTGEAVSEEKTVDGNEFGEKIKETALDIPGYKLSEKSKETQEIILQETDNEITFYYVKKEGPAGYNLGGGSWAGSVPAGLYDNTAAGTSPRYPYLIGFAKGDTFTVIADKPVKEGSVFIGWFDKDRSSDGGDSTTIRKEGDTVTYCYENNSAYTLDALWASLSATGVETTYDGQSYTITDDITFNKTLPPEFQDELEASGLIQYGDKQYSTNGISWQSDKPSFKDVGTYTIFVRQEITAGSVKTVLQAQAQVIIKARPVTITATNANKTYGEADPEFSDAVMSNNVEGELGDIDLSVSRSDAGDDTLGLHDDVLSISATKAELEETYTNYTFTITPADFTITTNETALTVSAEDVEKVYDGNSYGVTASAGVAGATIKYYNEETQEYDLDTSPTYKDVTNGEVTVKFMASLYGYADAYDEATVEITKRPVTITATNANKTYGEADPEFSDAVMSNNVEGELGDIDLSVSRSDAGDDTLGLHDDVLSISATKAELEETYTNYTFTITPADFTITTNETALTVSAEDVEKVYDGNSYGVTASAGVAGATIKYYNEETQEYDLDTSPTYKDVTNGEVTVKFMASLYGYADAYDEATVEITKRPVTITATNANKTYGEADPEFSDAVMSNNVEGELGDIDLSVSRSDAGDDTLGLHDDVLSISATKAELEETYTNYTFTITPADFTITTNETALTVSAEDVEKVYDGNSYGVTASAGVAGATIKYYNEETQEYDLDTSPTYKDVTNGEVTVKFMASLYGYADAYGEATVEITKRPVTITSESGTKVYDGIPLIKPNVQIGGNGFVAGEVKKVEATGSITQVGGPVPNSIVITPEENGGYKESNYSITMNEGSLVILGEVIYDGNTNTAGEVPVDENQYELNDSITVLGNTGNLTKEKAIFLGWSLTKYDTITTKEEAEKAEILSTGNTLTMGEKSITLYAVWGIDENGPEGKPDDTPDYLQYHLIYDGNGNTSGEAPTDSKLYNKDDVATLLGKGDLIREGATFIGWSLTKNELITSAAEEEAAGILGSTVTFTKDEDLTVYAVWAIDENGPEGEPDDTPDYLQYHLIYDGNGNTSGEAPTDSKLYNKDDVATLLGKGDLIREGATFIGWSLTKNELITSAAEEEAAGILGSTVTFTKDEDLTVYAVWAIDENGPEGEPDDTPDYLQYHLIYDGNGNTSGEAPTDSKLYNKDDVATLLGKGELVREGATFIGWSLTKNELITSAEEEAAAGILGSTVTFTEDADLTVYAVWAIDKNGPNEEPDDTPDYEEFSVTYDGNGEDSGEVIDNALYPLNYEVTVKDNAFQKANYAFDGWKYTAEGSEGEIWPTETFTITEDTTLFAHWEEDTKGGGDDGNNPDGIPDKYQIVFHYVSADTTKGIVMGTTYETHTFTDENGNYLEASTVPTSPNADVTVAALSGNAFDYWNVQGQDAKDFTETMDNLKVATYTEDTTFVANFDTDTKGGGDDAEEPDNIPDKYQVIFRYVSADTTMGTVTGEPTALVEVRTLTTPAGGYLEAASNPVSPRAEVTVNAAAGNSFVYWTDGTATDYSASLATIKTMTYSTDTTFTAYFSTNGTITVTKLLTVMDGMDEIPMASTEGLTYHFGLFTDAEGTTLLGEEYVKEVTMQNTSSAQLVFENVPDGTYYVFETDANGNALAYDTAQGSGTDSYVPVLNGPTNAVTIDLAAGTSTGQISVTNRYYMDPGGQYYIDAELNITKNVLDGGKTINPDQTFYAGVFTMNEDGTYQLLEGQVIALSSNGTVTTNVPLGGEYGTDEITYYVFETDAQGNILVSGDEAFGYDITGGGAVTLSQENFRETVEITNTVMDNGEEPNTEEPDTEEPDTEEPDTEPDTQESTETEKVTDTVKTNSVKTGDDTNIAIYLVVLIMAGYVLVVAKRRRQK